CPFQQPAGSSSPSWRRTTESCTRLESHSGGSGRSARPRSPGYSGAGGSPLLWPGRSSLAAGDLLLDGRGDPEGPDRDRSLQRLPDSPGPSEWYAVHAQPGGVRPRGPVDGGASPANPDGLAATGRGVRIGAGVPTTTEVCQLRGRM